MKTFREKRKSITAAIFLFSYLLLFTEHIFHVHHYDIQWNKTTSITKSKTVNDPFALGTSLCFLEHLYTTINIDNFTAKDILFYITGFTFLVRPESNKLLHISENLQPLRAPPSLSFFALS